MIWHLMALARMDTDDVGSLYACAWSIILTIYNETKPAFSYGKQIPVSRI